MAKTAAELMAEMQGDPEGQAVLAAHDRHDAESRQAYAAAARGLLADLHDTGVEATDMADVREQRAKGAVPVLISWLPRIEYLPLLRDVIATLGNRWTGRTAVDALFALYEQTDPETELGGKVRWAAADSLERLVSEADYERVLRLVQERTSHNDGMLLIVALGKMKSHHDEVVPLLTSLLADPAATGAALEALGKLGDKRQRNVVEPYTRDSDEWIREQARNAVRKLS